MKHNVSIVLAAFALLLVSCVSEEMLDNGVPMRSDGNRIEASSIIDDILPFGANQISVNVTVRPTDAQTKGEASEIVDTASVKVVSYHQGTNPFMEDSVYGSPASQTTKSIYSQNTTCQLNSNFLRLDEKIEENGSATYFWDNWGHSKLIEAQVIATPDHANDLFYRSITFTPTQAYNIRTYNDDRDTIFYHSRLVGWHPMILSVPRDGDQAAAVEFSNSRYANNRYNVSANEFGVVFDHTLDGSVDLMMSNIAEGQRWHKKFNPELPESSERETYNRKHYADKEQTQEEVAYSMPFGHYSSPEYASSLFYHHYLSAVRLWAVVESSGESTSMNLKTWGEIDNVSFVDQPSTAIIAIPKEASSAFTMKADGTLEKNPDGSFYINRQKLVFGEVISWGDETNLSIHPDRMFGNDSNNEDHDYTVQYPVDMTKDGGIRLSKTYLGYCLVKPYAYGELSETNGIKLAIQTSAGTYYATIPSIASYVDEQGETHKVDMFQEGQIYDVILNLRTEGSINEFIEKENDVNYLNLSPYDEQNGSFLSANCYIIDINDLQTRINNAAAEGPAGYCFTGSVMGNGQRGVVSDGSINFPTDDAVIRGATSARIVWQSKRDLISNVQLQHEYVRFIVNEATEGNAVIAVTDASGNILWSWHIWITDNPTKNPLNVTVIPAHEGIEAVTINMLDRNLGALRNNAGSDDAELFSSFGLYYQWGRKDPLPGPAEKNVMSSHIAPVYDGFSEETTNIYANSFGSGIESSIQNPMNYMYCDNSPYYQYDWMQRPINFIWGLNTGGLIQKTIYDPCPFGYRVPQEEVQQLFENASAWSQADGKGVTVTSAEGTNVFFPYAGFIGSERGQYSREPIFNYVSTKGDYTSGQIYPATTASPYAYYSNHRLRTYIAPNNWTEENIDGQNPYTFTVANGKYYVYYTDSRPRDYTNRTTAATVRCVQDKSYDGKGYAQITILSGGATKDVLPGNKLQLSIKGGLNIGQLNAVLTIQPYAGNTPVGEETELFLVKNDYPEFEVIKRTTTLIEGTYEYTYPNGFYNDGITSFTFTLKVSDSENPELVIDPARQSVTFSYAHLLYQENSTTSPASGKPLMTVESGRNFTKTNEPVVGQPATMTVYARKDVADAYTKGTPVVEGTVKNTDDSNPVTLTFNKSAGTQTIDGVEYYEFAVQYTNDFVGGNGGIKNSDITLSFTGADPSDKTTTATVNPDIKIWGLRNVRMGNRIVPKGIIMLRSPSDLYYLRTNSNSSVGYSSSREDNVYDYNNLFYSTTRVSWALTPIDGKGPSQFKSVRYSIAGGEDRFIHFSSTSRGAGTVADLSTTATDLYFSDLTPLSPLLTMYVNETKKGYYIRFRNYTLSMINDNSNPVGDNAAYHGLYMIDRVYDPVTDKEQDLPFTGTRDKNYGDFDENYLKF